MIVLPECAIAIFARREVLQTGADHSEAMVVANLGLEEAAA
jgi:hypothetical protein